MGHLQYRLVLETIVDEEKNIASKIYSNTFMLMIEQYESVAESLLLNDEILDAFENGDRKKLLDLTQPIYEKLRLQNPYLNVMHFHTKDNLSFLRVHQPDKFGDDLSGFRHSVKKVNQYKKKQTGVEVGRYGIDYRIVMPVFNHDGDHIGSFEFGVDIDYIFNIFHDNYRIDSILFLNKDIFKIIHEKNKDIKYKSFSDKYYVLEPEDNPISNVLPSSVFSNKYTFVHFNDIENLVFVVTKMKGITGENIGQIVFIRNLNAYSSQIAVLRYISIALGLTLILLSFYFVRKIFNYYMHTINSYQHQLEIKNRSLAKLSNMDHLTRIFNRRSIERVLSKELNRAKRYAHPLSIFILDIDNFKKINDTYGHNAGDKVLKHIAKMVTGMIRESDYFGRWGGEEFLLIATGTPIDKAAIIAEQIRKAIENFDFGQPEKVTCSIGVAQCFQDKDVTSLVAKADDALYKAKNSGKNCVIMHTDNTL